jgi:hypothetical protein
MHTTNTRRVHKLPELLAALGLLDHGAPLVKVRADELVHLAVEIGADAELVVDDDLSQPVEPALQLVEPTRSPGRWARSASTTF